MKPEVHPDILLLEGNTFHLRYGDLLLIAFFKKKIVARYSDTYYRKSVNKVRGQNALTER
jgi:hypothetical protein